MQEIFKTIWGQTKLARAALAIGTMVLAGVMILQGVNVPEWWSSMTTAAVLSYFVGRGTETP